VTILARNPDKVPAIRALPGVSVVRGAMKDYAMIAAALPGHEACIHNALCWGDSARDMISNDTVPSVFLMEMAAEAGMRHFIYTSSTAGFGDFKDNMTESMKSDPIDYYCATKSATEQYMIAAAYKTRMRTNVIRPGYVFGNPVVPGAKTEGDRRFLDIIVNARKGADITVTDNDGTQFIWAGDLARLYKAVLESDVNHQIYHGLGVPFITWEKIARLAIELTGSKSRIILRPNTYRWEPYLFDLSKIRDAFGLEFDAWPHIVEHVPWLIRNLP
jgi:UDP-glucose 4-epimerase